jgi:hypothetical protein
MQHLCIANPITGKPPITERKPNPNPENRIHPNPKNQKGKLILPLNPVQYQTIENHC